MSNFLELCQETLEDSDTASQGSLSNVTQANGFQRNVVNFVREAWIDIQSDQEDWSWMQESFQARLTEGVNRYQPGATAANPHFLIDADGNPAIPCFRSWLTGEDHTWYITDYRTNRVVGAEFPEIEYQTWRAFTLARGFPNQRPNVFAVAPNLDLVVNPTPDGTYDVDGEYQRGAQRFGLTDDNNDGVFVPISVSNPRNGITDPSLDIPLGLPANYHHVIKWRAIMKLHGFDEAKDSEEFAVKQYATVFNNMKRLYLPRPRVAPGIGS